MHSGWNVLYVKIWCEYTEKGFDSLGQSPFFLRSALDFLPSGP